ncbi:MAG: DegT/DnrJ/EryC1/StrS family aminotransferase [Phycisphaerales bacterium]|nr:DegT/DnrJ/EryC1/StrS family aminotransferase [Phycisphaerales bacterium]
MIQIQSPPAVVQVPLVDLRATYLPIREALLEQFDAILNRGQLFNGENLRAFESEFTRYCGAHAGFCCSNGTDALTLALTAFDFKPGFEAIVPAHTFFATIESVVHAGGVPVLIDIDPLTCTMDPARIEEALSPRTAVIVPVHIYGQPADMDPILDIARRRNLRVIEDAAQAHGARYKNRPAGSLADAASFSFYFTKNLGAFGEAGFVTVNDDALADRVALFRHHGHRGKFEHEVVGYNMRMDELQAAVLRAKLPRLDELNDIRRNVARRYNDAFADLDVTTPFEADYARHNYHCYVIQTDGRDALAQHLSDRGIGTGIHYKTPVHLQPAMNTIPHRALPMPVTESTCRRCLTLPCFPELTDAQIDHVIRSVRSYSARK